MATEMSVHHGMPRPETPDTCEGSRDVQVAP
jgi:hypothetical protein